MIMEIKVSALVIVYSYHHNNTEKVADVIANTLGADVKHPDEITVEDIDSNNLIGFGAGIDSGKHYAPLIEMAKALHYVKNKKAFIFSTSGIYGKKKMIKDHSALRDILISKGYSIIDEFSCAGFNTNSILKTFGGMNKGKPDVDDLKRAEDFASQLMLKMQSNVFVE